MDTFHSDDSSETSQNLYEHKIESLWQLSDRELRRLKGEVDQYFSSDYRLLTDLERSVGTLLQAYRAYTDREADRLATGYGVLDSGDLEELSEIVESYLEKQVSGGL